MADIIFEEIQPYIEGEGDTGKTSREKIKRNFEKVGRLLDGKVDKDSSSVTTIKDGSKYDSFVDSYGNEVARIGDIDGVGKGIQAEEYFNKKGEPLSEKIEELDGNIGNMLPKESDKNEVVRDAAASEVWVDKHGKVAMRLSEDGTLWVGKLKTNDDAEGGFVPLDSNDAAIIKDGSNFEVWVDKRGYIGMMLTGNGVLKVGKIESELSGSLENAIAFPKTIYALAGVQRNFWHQSLLARWNPSDYYLQFGGDAPYQRRTPLVATIKDSDLTKLNGKKITLSLIDFRLMKSVQQIENVTVRAARPKAENDSLGLVKVMFIGSSTTQSCYFREALTRYVSNYQLVGLRHRSPSLDDNDELIDPNDEGFNIIHEAHGGCTLGSFFGEPSTGATAHFFPFMQPDGNYRYWGATGFWKFAHLNKYTATSQNDIDKPKYHPYAYNNGCYIQSALDRFDSVTGLLINPTTNDIMYDTDNSRFVKFDGSGWQEVAKGDYTWSFQFGKYIDMWGLDTPDVVVITLGSNDFRNSELPIDFTEWNQLMNTLIDSVHDKNEDAKVVLCSQGPFGNNGYDGEPVAMLNYKCWLHFKNLIEMFGNLENQGVYVLDQTSELSAEYGFPVIMTGDTTKGQTQVVHTFPTTNYPLVYVTDLYHELYTHDGHDGEANPYYIEQKMKVLNADSIHPNMSYANMGVPIAAFLQYIRQNNLN